MAVAAARVLQKRCPLSDPRLPLTKRICRRVRVNEKDINSVCRFRETGRESGRVGSDDTSVLCRLSKAELALRHMHLEPSSCMVTYKYEYVDGVTIYTLNTDR